MKNIKRILSLLLILAMCLSLLPLSAFAEEGEDGFTAEESSPGVFVEENAGEICPHEWGDWAMSAAPGCTTEGVQRRICLLCGEEEAEVLPPAGHTPADTAGVPAEPGRPGVGAGIVCAVCGEVLAGCEEIPALPEAEEAETEADNGAGDAVFAEEDVTADGAVPEDAEADGDGEGPAFEAQFKTWINPVYADLIDESDLPLPPSPEELIYADTEDTIYSDFSEAAKDLRAQAVQRLPEVSVSYYLAPGEDPDEISDALFDAIFDHTGVGAEGDSLHYSIGGASRMLGKYTEGGVVLYITCIIAFDYLTTAAQESALSALVPSVLAGLQLDGKTVYQKLEAIYDYLCRTVSYDYDSPQLRKHTSYAALVEHSAVCQGISSAFYRLCLEAGLDARVIACVDMNHAWNIALCPDGNYYALDTTWDITEENRPYYRYFLRGRSWWLTYHDYGGLSLIGDNFSDPAFLSAYPFPTTDYTPTWADTHTHSLTHVPAREPSCQNSGNYEYWECSGCGKYFSDASASTETTPAAVIRPRVGHAAAAGSYHPYTAPTVTEPGNVEYWICRYCSRPVDAQNNGNLIADVTIPPLGPSDSGTWGNNLSWDLDRYGVLTISGAGDMDDFAGTDSDGAWRAHASGITAVTVAEGVTGIGAWAFGGCANLTDVTLPDTVTVIGANAFNDCVSLTGITVPAGAATIGAAAFGGCAALDDVYYYGTQAQWDDITIDTGNEALTDAAMHYVTAAGSCGDNLFWMLEAPGVLTIRGSGTMSDYTQDSAPWHACADAVRTVVLESGVTGICSAAFSGCAALTGFEAAPDSAAFGSTDGVLYSKDGKTLLCFPGGKSESFTVPEGVQAIAPDAFALCAGLESVTLPQSLTSIGNAAFSGCAALTRIDFTGKAPAIAADAFRDVDAAAFYPPEDTSYTAQVRQNYGGTLTWKGGFTIRYDANGGTGAPPAQAKTCGRDLRLREGSPRRTGYDFLGWALTPEAAEAQYQPGDLYTADEDAVLHALWRPVGMKLAESYLLLKAGETSILHLLGLDGTELDAGTVVWSVENADGREDVSENVIRVDAGTVLAVGRGTAYAAASIPGAGGTLSVRCRIDVTAGSIDAELVGVRLLASKVTTELYRADYTEIPVELVLEQNGHDVSGQDDNGVGGRPGNTGMAVTGAELLDPAAKAVFRLAVRDDRTLLIVPTIDLENAAAVKAVNGSYKSAIRLTAKDVTGAEKTTTSGQLTIAVKKSLPKLKAKAVTLNSYLPADARPINISGGTVTALTPDPGQSSWTQAAGECPVYGGWVKLDGSGLVFQGNAGMNRTASLNLMATVEGWAKKIPVTVPVSAARTAPMLALQPSRLNLQAGCGDRAETAVSITPAGFEDWKITVQSISGKSPEDFEKDYGYFSVEADGRTVRVTAGETVPPGGRERSCRVTLALLRPDGQAAGLAATLTVNLLEENSTVLTAKARGAIDLTVENSPVTLVPTLRNYSAPVTYSVTEILDAGGTPRTEYFNISDDSLVITAKDTLKDKIPAGKSAKFTAVLSVSGPAGEIPLQKPATVSFTVKRSARIPAKSVILKAAGAVDVIRPGSAVVLTPTLKNLYGYDLNAGDLTIKRIYDGKTEQPCDENVTDTLFRVVAASGKYVVTAKEGVSHLDRFTVRATIGGQSSRTLALNVIMGKAKIAQSTKSVVFSQYDRYARFVIRLTPEAGLAEIAGVEVISPAGVFARPIPLGNGEYAIDYAGHELPVGFRGGTMKLKVFLAGNMTAGTAGAVPNAIASVKVALR